MVIEGGGTGINRKIVDPKKIRENRVKFWKSRIQVHFAVIRDFPPEVPSIASSSRSLIIVQPHTTEIFSSDEQILILTDLSIGQTLKLWYAVGLEIKADPLNSRDRWASIVIPNTATVSATALDYQESEGNE